MIIKVTESRILDEQEFFDFKFPALLHSSLIPEKNIEMNTFFLVFSIIYSIFYTII